MTRSVFLTFLILVTICASISLSAAPSAIGQADGSAPTDSLNPKVLGEDRYQELKAAGLIPQPEQVSPPSPLLPRNTISPEAIERSRGLLIPLDETFTGLSSNEEVTGEIRLRSLPNKPSHSIIGPGFSRTHIEVKFLDDIDVGLEPNGYPIDRSSRVLKSPEALSALESITVQGGMWRRMVDIPEETLDRLRAKAEVSLRRKMADINTYFVLSVPPAADAEEWINLLNALPEVEIALALPLPAPLPIPPSYVPLQGYLNEATDGIGAQYAWGFPAGTGGNVTICDIEYSWNLDHQDLPSGITTYVPPGYTSIYPAGGGCADQACNHGTAVLGEIASLNNGWGTTGIAYGASLAVAPCFLDNGTGPALLIEAALINAAANLSPGDVILIEQQLPGPGGAGAYIPVEWYKPVYDAILIAVGNGIHVIEAAGNGGQNLDDPIYGIGNDGHWPFLPGNGSGAIIVGAGAIPASFGGSDTDRSRLTSSTYGSRVDLQGWGQGIVTTGYGDFYDAEGANLYYASLFAGTSGASPIVACAVVLMESVYEAITGGRVITPRDMRSILVTTGSPQLSGTNPSTEHIGPRPNLRLALPSVVPFTNGAPPQYRNDDGSTDLMQLAFPFCFYGTTYNQMYINNNGNLSFQDPYYHYTPSGFPISDFGMIAPFWADIDTRNPGSGLVYYKSELHRFTVVWDRVGYFGSHADKLNTFEVIITDGWDPLIGLGNNVCFSYGDMQWTTGDASGGSGGFGGAPATVGVNRGDGTNYALVGRFNHEGIDYDGPGGNSDGVSYLDGRNFFFSVCQGLGTISGYVFNDANNNGTREFGEAGIPGWTVTLNPGGLATLTDAFGGYFFSFLEPNTYTVAEVPRANWQQTYPPSPGVHVIDLSLGQTVSGMDFGNRALASVQDLAISVAGGPARPGFQKQYGIYYENKGTVPTGAIVTLRLPTQVTYLESSPGGNYSPGSYTVTWDVGTLAPGFIGWLWTRVQIPVLVPLGTVLTSIAQISPLDGDANLLDNVDLESQLIRGSFDPNDKAVNFADLVERADTLRYQINFQNTGTDTAFNVIVRDSLDLDLDIATVQNGASSHPYVFQIVGRELSWTFSNIDLPESSVNEPASHGFVTFKVRPNPGVEAGTELANRAAIYFDFNPAVNTNTVINHITEEVLTAQFDFRPDTLNLKSDGRWITCYVELPAGYDVGDIDMSSLKLNGVVSAEARPWGIGDYDADAISDLMVKFSRERVGGAVIPGSHVAMTLTGKVGEREFSGTDYIVVFRPPVLPDEEGQSPSVKVVSLETYPNPFNPLVRIVYGVPRPARVIVQVLNVEGRLMRTLEDAERSVGMYTIEWDGKDQAGKAVTSGLYFCRLVVGDEVLIKKIALLR